MELQRANSTPIDERTVLRKAPALTQIVCPSHEGEVYVLQFADGECNVAFSEGGPLVWELLDLCDGLRTFGDVRAEIRQRFDGPEELWSQDLPNLLQDLIAWRALEAISPG